MPTPLKQMPESLRQQVAIYNKKKIDISPLIEGYNISNENLSNAYISNLYMVEQNISGCNFSNSSVKLIAIKSNAMNCNFRGTQFLPGSSLRSADCRKSNFTSANGIEIDAAYADLRDIDLCDARFSLFSKKMFRARFSNKLVLLMQKFLDVEGLGMVENNEII